MKTYKNAEMESFYASEDASGLLACEVRIGDEKIVVSYYDEGFVVYEGIEVAPGHFRLHCEALKARATLHRTPGDGVLEGSWIENGYEGMFRIELNRAEEPPPPN